MKSSKRWWIVGGMAASFAVVVILAGLVGGVLYGAIPVSAEEGEPTWPCGNGRWFGWGGRSWTMFDTVAEALGLTPRGLFTELHDGGMTVAEIAEEKAIDIEVVQDALHGARSEAMQQAIEQAVADGKLSQEQADWLLERMADREEDCPSGPGGFFGMRHGRWGRFGGFGRHIPPTQEQ